MVVNDMDDFDKQSKAGGEQSSYFDEHPGQDMAYAPQGSQHATFGNQLPPRPPADAAQDPAHVKRGTGGWFKDRRTPSPEQGSLYVRSLGRKH